MADTLHPSDVSARSNLTLEPGRIYATREYKEIWIIFKMHRGLLVRLLCQLRFKHLLCKQRSAVWKSPTEAFKGCGSPAKSNIWAWSGREVHRRNLFIPPPQMRISAAVRMHLRVLGNNSRQVTGRDRFAKESDYTIRLFGQAAHYCCRKVIYVLI